MPRSRAVTSSIMIISVFITASLATSEEPSFAAATPTPVVNTLSAWPGSRSAMPPRAGLVFAGMNGMRSPMMATPLPRARPSFAGQTRIETEAGWFINTNFEATRPHPNGRASRGPPTPGIERDRPCSRPECSNDRRTAARPLHSNALLLCFCLTMRQALTIK